VLGAEEGRLLRPSLARARSELKALAEEYGLNIDPDAVIEEIGVGMQQRVEILSRRSIEKQKSLFWMNPPGC